MANDEFNISEIKVEFLFVVKCIFRFFLSGNIIFSATKKFRFFSLQVASFVSFRRGQENPPNSLFFVANDDLALT